MQTLVGVACAVSWLAAAAQCHAWQAPWFFRVVSTQATTIVHCDLSSGIMWSNTSAPAICRVEWTPDLAGLWLTNHFVSVTCSNHLGAIPLHPFSALGTHLQ